MTGKVITFLGPDHKAGTTSIAKAIAEAIAKDHPDKKVLFIDAEGEYLGMWRHGIKIETEEGSKDIASIIKMARQKDNLFAMTSCQAVDDLFHPDMAEYFISSLKGSSDMDYIICASGEIEHSMAIGSLLAADSIYIVFSHDQNCESGLRRYEWMKALYEKLDLKIDGFILNKFNKMSAYSPWYIVQRLGIDESILYSIRTAEQGQEKATFSMLGRDNPEFTKDIKSLVKTIIKEEAVENEI